METPHNMKMDSSEKLQNQQATPTKQSVEIVLPVFNEEKVLPLSVAKLHAFLTENVKNPWQILIADNGSEDGTREIGKKLASKYSNVLYDHIAEKGRGWSLNRCWLASKADIVSYMDIDLSTHLEAFPHMLDEIESGYDMVIGSRLISGSQVQNRTLIREITSRCYNLLIRMMFFTNFNDAQCGFKALTRNTAQGVLPKVLDRGWFFDSEILLVASRRGYRIKEIPVKWTDDPDSKVNIPKTAWNNTKGLLRLRFGGKTK